MKPPSPSGPDILDKIRKLLRLADRSRGATENEAKVALAKAQELMTRHNIDSARLRMESGEKSGFQVNKSTYELPKTLNPADMLILSLLQSHFNVRVIMMSLNSKTAVDMIGTPEDVEFAIFALNFLRKAFFRGWNEFKKSATSPHRPSYYRGVFNGLNQALTEAACRAADDYGTKDRNSYAVALHDKDAAIAAYVKAGYPSLKQSKTRRTKLHAESYQNGHSHGRKIKINRPLTDNQS